MAEKRRNCTPEERRKMVEQSYFKKFGKPLNLDAPKCYTEKIQWTKLYGRTELMSRLADKYAVREWVKDKIGEEYLIPVLQTVKSFEEINFDTLPDSFAIKCCTGAGWNIIVRDKAQCSKREIRKKMDYWSRQNYAYYTLFEMQYETIPMRFNIEKYMADKNGELNDYKFLCFQGKPKYCWTDYGRFTEHHVRTVYDMNWVPQPWSQRYPPSSEIHLKPENFEKMVELAAILCQGFPHVRVDLYNVDGKIYFGEMTFTSGGGFQPIIPDEYDEILGSMFQLPAESLNQQ